VPVRWAKIALPILYLSSLVSSWFAAPLTPAIQNDPTKTEPVAPEETDVKPVSVHDVCFIFRFLVHRSHWLAHTY